MNIGQKNRMSSRKKREFAEVESLKSEFKKIKLEDDEEDDMMPSTSHQNRHVVLNPADCNLDFNIKENGRQGSDLDEDDFVYCWSGARATVGITGGKYCFGCQILVARPIYMKNIQVEQQRECRVGISSVDDPVGNLGETLPSFGYAVTGKFSNDGKFSDYGERFGVSDVIICCVDLETKPLASIAFYKNGNWLGIAKYFDAGNLSGSALFPHVLLKNEVVLLQFSREDGLIPVQGFKPWSSAIEDGVAVLGPTLSHDGRDCEMRMLVGLPASGKTTWAEKWIKEHPEKRYVLLGTNLALDQMKVHGLQRTSEHWMNRATSIFNTLLSRASILPRNFIIDQTNVTKIERKHRLRPFLDLQKIAVVILTTPEELRVRYDKQFKEMGKQVNTDVVKKMLANFVLPMSKDMPETDEFFDLVFFPELGRAESEICLVEMKESLTSNKELLPYTLKSFGKSPIQ